MILEYKFRLDTLNKSESALELHEELRFDKFFQLHEMINKAVLNFINQFSDEEIEILSKIKDHINQETIEYDLSERKDEYIPGICL